MDPDHKDLLASFNEHQVDYVIVGGQAVNSHGVPRYTKDLDIFIRASPRNSHATYRALAAFGAPLGSITPEELRDGKTVVQLGVEPNRIDILQKIAGIEFDQVWENRITAEIDGTLRAPLISVDDLIQNKLGAGRPQDLADVANLRRIRQLREEIRPPE